MTHAYKEQYLDDAMETLGAAVEHAVLSCGVDGQEFLDLFVASGIADEFGRGNVLYVSGMSGIELANKVFQRTGKAQTTMRGDIGVGYPPEYWVGWILAYYQWYRGKSFSVICRTLRYDTMRKLYGVLHEADPSKAVDSFDSILARAPETNLARFRRARGFSQSQLAEAADISLRSIQLYEQKQNDINNAQYNRLQALAKALGCQIEDILE